MKTSKSFFSLYGIILVFSVAFLMTACQDDLLEQEQVVPDAPLPVTHFNDPMDHAEEWESTSLAILASVSPDSHMRAKEIPNEPGFDVIRIKTDECNNRPYFMVAKDLEEGKVLLENFAGLGTTAIGVRVKQYLAFPGQYIMTDSGESIVIHGALVTFNENHVRFNYSISRVDPSGQEPPKYAYCQAFGRAE